MQIGSSNYVRLSSDCSTWLILDNISSIINMTDNSNTCLRCELVWLYNGVIMFACVSCISRLIKSVVWSHIYYVHINASCSDVSANLFMDVFSKARLNDIRYQAFAFCCRDSKGIKLRTEWETVKSRLTLHFIVPNHRLFLFLLEQSNLQSKPPNSNQISCSQTF